MSSTRQIICGIDPGLQQSGYGVIQVDDEDDAIRVLDAGIVRTTGSLNLSLRLAELAAGVGEVLDEHSIDAVAVEQIYSHYRQPRTAILMAHARGVILLEAARRNINVLHLPSTTVKRHMTGNGRASKEQMQRAVTDFLRLERPPEPPDVADAVAIAICAASALNAPAKLALTNDDLLC